MRGHVTCVGVYLVEEGLILIDRVHWSLLFINCTALVEQSVMETEIA